MCRSAYFHWISYLDGVFGKEKGRNYSSPYYKILCINICFWFQLPYFPQNSSPQEKIGTQIYMISGYSDGCGWIKIKNSECILWVVFKGCSNTVGSIVSSDFHVFNSNNCTNRSNFWIVPIKIPNHLPYLPPTVLYFNPISSCSLIHSRHTCLFVFRLIFPGVIIYPNIPSSSFTFYHKLWTCRKKEDRTIRNQEPIGWGLILQNVEN